MKTANKQVRSQGFTLIELMIVIAIIGILTTVAAPMYQDYTVRSKVAASMSAVNSIKFIVAEVIARQGVAPEAGNAKSGLADKEDYADDFIQSIEILTSGSIQVMYKNLGAGFTANDSATFSPTIMNGMLRWHCQLSRIELQTYFPKSCTKSLPVDNASMLKKSSDS
jgi:type IV pilus assembly protein PilA|tara:strand:- start:124165 stop:124665 length:501 start_codon:yes stop_codon:yes gene_type:complete